MAMNPRLLRPLATGFNPKQISGLALWLDAADASTITLNGSTASQWVDKSATASVWSQSTAANQPSLSSLNGKTVLESDGTKLMTGNAASLAIANGLSSATLFLVGSTVSYDATGRYIFSLSQAGSAAPRLGFGSWSVVNGKFLTFRPDGASFASLAYSHNTNSEINAAQWNASAPGSQVWRNGTSENFFVAQGVSMPASNSQGTSVFGLHNGSGLIAGTVAEILVYARALSATERQRVEGYLAWKWGLQAQLPYNHPYAQSFPGYGSQTTPTDPDALTYLAAVAAADGTGVEVSVANAVDDFVKGCKADGIWDAIKASCILMGARTLLGALTPLKGPAPINNGPFVSGDYDRKTGLKGNGTSKYLDTGRAANASGQNNVHGAVYGSDFDQPIKIWMGASDATTKALGMFWFNGFYFLNINRAAASNDLFFTSLSTAAGLVGVTRTGASSGTGRAKQTNFSITSASTAPPANNYFVFANNTGSAADFSAFRSAFYSAGDSLNLALLETRVAALYSAIGAAIL